MIKSKRQRQIDLLEKLMGRVQNNEIPENTEEWKDNVSWIHKKYSQVKGGDIELDSGGLSKEDMHKANTMWTRYSPEPATNEMPA